MKKITSCAFLFATIAATYSCKKSAYENETSNSNSSSKQVQAINTITGANTCFDWEANPYINFTNFPQQVLPWYSSTAATLPEFVMTDYKREDGWELIYNFLSQSTNEQNYVIYYNKFTGLMRTFYYLKSSVTTGEGMWGLGFNNTSALLNNMGYFAEPIDAPIQEPLSITTNLSKNPQTKGVAPGWNGFDTEITYDPNAESKVIKMGLFSYASNISHLTLTGDIALSSEGTIATIGSKNGLQNTANNAAKSVGDIAKNYVKDKVKGTNPVIKVASTALSAIVGGGVKEIIGAGINLLFGSFIGKKTEATSTNQKIEFKTNGTLNATGTITSTSSNNVVPIANLYTPGTTADPNNFILPCYTKKLGVWNLLQKPVVLTSRKATAIGEGDHPEHYQYGRQYFVDLSSINVAINPDVLSEIDSYEVKADLLYYAKFQNNLNWNDVGSGVGMYYDGLLYDDGQNKFYQGSSVSEIFYGPTPVIDPNGDNDVSTVPAEGAFNKRYVVKVTVTLIPKAGYNQTPIVITRSYLPNYQFFD
ncbi:hypothetical protein [uncultured Mucilaginibacter sp.]|uniref:hypothetical protein n=1 Tax=uncultured Mucilaginibacter sp. TaxID=797541 RepID=UPI0025E16C4D|nr:hypothetical protein [uncultured Mucilaginibacter sp.]